MFYEKRLCVEHRAKWMCQRQDLITGHVWELIQMSMSIATSCTRTWKPLFLCQRCCEEGEIKEAWSEYVLHFTHKKNKIKWIMSHKWCCYKQTPGPVKDAVNRELRFETLWLGQEMTSNKGLRVHLISHYPLHTSQPNFIFHIFSLWLWGHSDNTERHHSDWLIHLQSCLPPRRKVWNSPVGLWKFRKP